MIYDFINSAVYVVLAQLFYSVFLQRKQQSRMVAFLITILWVLICVFVGNVFEESFICRIIIAVLVNVIFSFLIYGNKNFIVNVVTPILYYVLVIACEVLVVAIHRYFDTNLMIEELMESSISIYMGILSQLIQFVIVFIIRRFFHKNSTSEIGTKLWMIYMVFPIYSLSLIVLLVYSFDGPINHYQKNYFTYTAVSLLVINLLIYWFIKRESKRSLEVQRNVLEIEHARSIVQLYEQITTERDILGKREHEFKNIITVLRGLIEAKQYDKIKEILDVQNVELMNNTNIFETGNRLINTILNTKYAEARTKDIAFRFVIGDLSSLMIEDRDCIVILTNVLNNAIEAAEQCDENNRSLSIKLTIEDGQFIFACRNSFVDDNNSELRSKKQDIISHGYGLGNIKDAVDRNNGNYYFDKENNEFVSVVMIPV